jgi:CO/xanthine dehydrogenase Mo-binding subunit
MNKQIPSLDVIGKRQPRLDAREKVSGRAVYTDDVSLPGMLHARIVRSPHPRARIKSIDISEALQLPGVRTVITGDHTPTIMYGENQPMLAIGEVRYIGEEVVALAATDPKTAEDALALIKVEYEPLPSVVQVRQAVAPNAPLVHGQSPGNIALSFDKDYGDPDDAFSKCVRVITDEFKSPAQHNCLAELHIAVADFSDVGKLIMWTPTQSAPIYQRGLAKAFGLSENQVQMRFLHVGGAFTGRGMPRPHHFIAAELSRRSGRPVKLRAYGDEEFIMFRSSGETVYKFRTGIGSDGKVKVIDLDVSLDCGAHIEYAMLLYSPASYLTWLYGLDAIRYSGKLVYTNTVPKASHHGGIFGRLNAGLIQHFNHVAEELGVDPVAFHLQNAVDPGHRALDGAYFASCGLKECIEKVAQRAGWAEKYGKLPPYRGIGIGIGAMASGGKIRNHDTSAAQIKVGEDGIVTVFTGIPDMGQGSHTTMGVIAAETLGIDVSMIRIVAGDSDVTPFDWGAFAQRGTVMTGNAVKNACLDAKDQLAAVAATKLKVPKEDIVFSKGQVYARGKPENAMTFDKVAAAALDTTEGRFVMGRGFFNNPLERGSLAFSFGAQIAEVEIDPGTGIVKVLKVTVAHDLGRAINPLAVEGQLDGQVFSGLSQILYEEVRTENGQAMNPSRLEYKLPRTYELPDVEHILVETNDPFGPYGAKEVGEGPIVVTMSAVASAVANALNGMMTEMPMTPWRILRTMKQRKGATRA